MFRKTMLIIITLLIFSIYFIGCVPTVSNTKAMNSWKDSHISAVIRSSGPPNQITSDGAGGRIYIYTWSEEDINHPNLLANLYGTESKYIPKVTQHVRMFYVRPNGIVYHWLAR